VNGANRERWRRRAPSIVLAAVLVLTASLKLLEGHRPDYLVSESVLYLVAGVEYVLAALLILRRVLAGAIGAILIFGGGVFLASTHTTAHCGCLGRLGLSPRTHLLVAAGCGVLASVVLLIAITPTAPRNSR